MRRFLDSVPIDVKLTSYITLVESLYWIAFKAYPINPNVKIDDGDDIFGESPRAYLTQGMLDVVANEEEPSIPFDKRVFEFEMITTNCVYYDYFQELLEKERNKAINFELRLLHAQRQLFKAINDKKIIPYGWHYIRFREGYNRDNVPEYKPAIEALNRNDPRGKGLVHTLDGLEYLKKYAYPTPDTFDYLEKGISHSDHLEDWEKYWQKVPSYLLADFDFYCWELSSIRNIECYSSVLLRTGDLLGLFPKESSGLKRSQSPIVSGMRESEIHLLIERLYREQSKNGGNVPARDIWRAMKRLSMQENGHDLIQEVTDNKILWRSSYGNEQCMSWRTFNNVVSLVRQKKGRFT